MNESCAKVKYVGEFSQLKIHSLAIAKKNHVLIGGQTLHICLSGLGKNTNHRSILAVNNFYACLNSIIKQRLLKKFCEL